MSVSLYTTFGNELNYRVTNDTLVQFLKNSTIPFPLPEASSTILSELADFGTINPVELDTVRARLESIGFQKPNARAMAGVLISIAKQSGTSPMDYFDANEQSLKLTADAYKTMNMMRPPGNRVGLAVTRNNRRTRFNKLIQP